MDATAEQVESRLIDIYRRGRPPTPGELAPLVERVNGVLDREPAGVRPADSSGSPGGLVYLRPDIPTVVVPDLHARLELPLCLMRCDGGGREPVIRMLAEGRIQVVCVGDGFHAEARAARRWQLALEEYRSDYERHAHMDLEMAESFGVMEMVMELKAAFPERFHFLKGNHENIANQLGDGNFPFRKFAQEGRMVARYMEKFYGEELLASYASFEKRLPLLAVGRNFLISHAEPEFFFSREEVIEYRTSPEVVEGLTWTPNDGAEEGSVERMLDHYLPPGPAGSSFYFGGHRPVTGLYNRRAEGRYVQVHNPGKFIIACLPAEEDIDLDRDIREIENQVAACRLELDLDGGV